MDLNVKVNKINISSLAFRVPNLLQIHGTGFFLPWHRIYVQTLEDEMRAKCGYTGVQPYWDWTLGDAFS